MTIAGAALLQGSEALLSSGKNQRVRFVRFDYILLGYYITQHGQNIIAHCKRNTELLAYRATKGGVSLPK
jgi:hypothetical protein